MKFNIKLLLATFLLLLSEQAKVQTPDLSATNMVKEKYSGLLNDLIKRMPSSVNNNERSRDFFYQADTIYSYSNNVQISKTIYIYDEINGTRQPVTIFFENTGDNTAGSAVLEYDLKNRIVKISGVVTENGIEQNIEQRTYYDNYDDLYKIELEIDFAAFKLVVFDSLEIVRDDNGIVQKYTHINGISNGFEEDSQIVTEITVSAYNSFNGDPLTFSVIDYKEGQVTKRDFFSIQWYNYNNNLYNFFDFNIEAAGTAEDFLVDINNTILENLILAGILELYEDGVYKGSENYLIVNQSGSLIDISINNNVNAIYHLNNDGLLIRQEYKYANTVVVYYEFEYNGYGLQTSEKYYELDAGEYKLEYENVNDFAFDNDDRLLSMNEIYGEEFYRTEFRYATTTSAYGKENVAHAITIYPNPGSEFLIIHKNPAISDKESYYSIFDLQGNVIINNQAYNSSNGKINISFLIPGIYILQWQDAAQIATIKFNKL